MKRHYLQDGLEQGALDRMAAHACATGHHRPGMRRAQAGSLLTASMGVVLFGMAGVAGAVTAQAAPGAQCRLIDGRQHCGPDAGIDAAATAAPLERATTQRAATPAAATAWPNAVCRTWPAMPASLPSKRMPARY